MSSIYCDGACSGNGTSRAYGGWAWAFWPGAASGEPKFCGSAKLDADGAHPATNQRAELKALLEALRWSAAHPELSITIYTDSMYAINCTSKWGPGWKKKGWKRDSGEPLQNLDLVKPLVEIWKPCWTLQHVRGHQTGSSPAVHGNNWVDRAAVLAAQGSGSSGSSGSGSGSSGSSSSSSVSKSTPSVSSASSDSSTSSSKSLVDKHTILILDIPTEPALSPSPGEELKMKPLTRKIKKIKPQSQSQSQSQSHSFTPPSPRMLTPETKQGVHDIIEHVTDYVAAVKPVKKAVAQTDIRMWFGV